MKRALIGWTCALLLAGCGWKLQPREASEPASNEDAALARAVPFSLANDDGTFVSLDELLAKGPVVLVFYRGHW